LHEQPKDADGGRGPRAATASPQTAVRYAEPAIDSCQNHIKTDGDKESDPAL